MEKLLPEPCVCQKTPSLPLSRSVWSWRLLKDADGFIDADELMVLGDDFLVVVVEEDEVFDVVDEGGGVAEAVGDAL